MTISVSTILGVGIGLFLVYYILSLIVSWITSQIAGWMNLRSENLKDGLLDLLEVEGLGQFLEIERIKNLGSKDLSFFTGVVKSIGLEEISTSAFSQAFLEMLELDLKEDADLIERFKKALEEAHTDGLITKTTKEALLGMIDSGVKNLNGVHKSIETLFDETMIKISSLYKQYARRIAIIVSLIVTLVSGVDSIAIVRHLWQTPSLQQAAAIKADEYLKEPSDADLETYIAELDALGLPVFWDFDALPDDVGGWGLKVMGLLFTWLAASQGSSFWYQVLKRVRTVATTSPETNTAKTQM